MSHAPGRLGVLASLLWLGLGSAGCGDDASSASGSGTEGTDTAESATTGTNPTDADASSSTSVDDSESADESSSSGGEPPPPEVVPPPGGVRRLLAPQYVRSVGLIFGDAAAEAATPPEDPNIGNYDAMGTLVSAPAPADVELYEGSSYAIAEAVVDDPSHLALTAPCVVDGPFDDSCYTQVAEEVGRLAWRRPLNEAELDRLTEIADMARTWDEGEFITGVEYMVAAIVQSPNFLYIVEVGAPGDGNYRELDGYEMATRLSFFLAGRTPDADALSRAEAGDLDTDEGVRSLAHAILQTAEARVSVEGFFGEYLTIRNVTTKSKDPELFPGFSDELKDSMLEETMLLINDVVFIDNASTLSLFDSNTSYVNGTLAEFYGVDAPPSGIWQRVEMPAEQQRAGVLTQGAWLSMMSHTNVNSPTRRGLFVMEKLLCTEVPLPPPRVNPEPVVPEEGLTLRETLLQHMEDPACSSCHALTDPIGFAFENYDATGAFRTLDNGKPIDATGELAGFGSFDGAKELGDLLANDPRLPGCMVENVFTQALGHVPNDGQEPALEEVTLTFSDEDHRFRRMLVELISSPVFRQVDQAK